MPLTREQRESARRAAHRIFAALTDGERSDLMTEMVFGTGEAAEVVRERFYEGRKVPTGVMSALAREIEGWEGMA